MPPPKAEERVVPVPAGQALVPSSGETPVSGVQNAQSEPIQKLSRAETDGLHKKERVKVCRVDQVYVAAFKLKFLSSCQSGPPRARSAAANDGEIRRNPRNVTPMLTMP